MPRRDPRSEQFGDQRYALHLPLRFRAYRGAILVKSGEGETLSIGARDVLFWTERAPEGALVAELSIEWPVRLDGCMPLQLHVFGEIDSCAGQHVLVHISDYEFKLRSSLAKGAGR